MATENPKISGYVPQEIAEKLEQLRIERGLKSTSQALTIALSEYFGLAVSGLLSESKSSPLSNPLAADVEQLTRMVEASQVRLSELEAKQALLDSYKAEFERVHRLDSDFKHLATVVRDVQELVRYRSMMSGGANALPAQDRGSSQKELMEKISAQQECPHCHFQGRMKSNGTRGKSLRLTCPECKRGFSRPIDSDALKTDN